ncbi:MAG TPA: hypothetical protein QGH10_17870 [Armatimonadota bacterium]|nr:hypothetical protein [Armatimonadota bacterium]
MAAGSWPTAEEIVWEIGAATGAATVLAAAAAKQVYAVEKASEKLEKLQDATAGCDNVTLIDAEAPDAAPDGARADWLFLDVGGDAPPWRTMELAERWAEALSCERIVIRNTAAWTFLNTADARVATGFQPVDSPADIDPTLLVQRILDCSSRDAARKLAAGLTGAGFKARQRLVEGLVCLGPTALRPLATLVADAEAPLASRRAAAEAVRQIADRIDSDTRRALRKESAAVEWALGPLASDLDTPGTQLAAAEREKRTLESTKLLRILDHPDEVVRFAARQHLRDGGEGEAEKLIRTIAGEKSFFGPVIAALDAVRDVKRVDAERACEWYFDTTGANEATCWRFAAATLGVADAKWAQELLTALAGRTDDVPTESLAQLMRAAQKNPRGKDAVRLLDRLVKTDAPIAALATSASLSPHPWMREIADALGQATYEEE